MTDGPRRVVGIKDADRIARQRARDERIRRAAFDAKPDDGSGRPTIRLAAGRLPEIASEAERALIAAGVPFFQRGGMLVRPVTQEVDIASNRRSRVVLLVPVDVTYMIDSLMRVADWEGYDGRADRFVAKNVPHEIAQTILARRGEWRFPPVAGVINTPTLRPDGSVLREEGYDPQTRLILAASPTMPALMDNPTQSDARAALETLNKLLTEFAFANEASRAVVLSGMVTSVVRALFPVVPAHVISATAPGAGKSYSIDIISAIATGDLCPVMAAGVTIEETDKRLGAALLSGVSLISIDNVSGDLGGDLLCQAVERPVVNIRPLGKSEHVRVESRAIFFSTGNNVVLIGDMTRRAIVAKLDPGEERPELRQFKSDPVAAVLADRGRYVAAALTIVRAYLAAGRPNPAPRLASFHGWSDTVRSALIWIGCADPVDTMLEARDEDPQYAALRQVLVAWADANGTGYSTRVLASTMLTMIEERDGAVDQLEDGRRPYRWPAWRDAVHLVAANRGRVDAKRFGRWLARNRGRVVSVDRGRKRLRIQSEGDEHGHGKLWWCEETDDASAVCAVSADDFSPPF